MDWALPIYLNNSMITYLTRNTKKAIVVNVLSTCGPMSVGLWEKIIVYLLLGLMRQCLVIAHAFTSSEE